VGIGQDRGYMKYGTEQEQCDSEAKSGLIFGWGVGCDVIHLLLRGSKEAKFSDESSGTKTYALCSGDSKPKNQPPLSSPAV
jgi:hypothetical protein